MFKRCNQPKGALPTEITCFPHADSASFATAESCGNLNSAAARLPLSEQGGNMPCAFGQAVTSYAKERPSADEDPLFWTAVEGCMALFSQHAAPTAARSWPPDSRSSAALRLTSDLHATDSTDDTAPAVEAPIIARAPSPTLLGGIGAIVVNGKRLRSARCGQCRGCNSGDCGKCKNCLDKVSDLQIRLPRSSRALIDASILVAAEVRRARLS